MHIDRHAGDLDRCGSPTTGPGRPAHVQMRISGSRHALSEEAGLHDIAEWDVTVELVTESPAQYREAISGLLSLSAATLQQVGEGARGRIWAHAIADVSRFSRYGAVRVSGLAPCVVGTKWRCAARPRTAEVRRQRQM